MGIKQDKRDVDCHKLLCGDKKEPVVFNGLRSNLLINSYFDIVENESDTRAA